MPHEIVSFDDEAIKGYVGKLVLSTVQETINALLDEEAEQLVNAGRYERTDERQAYRSGDPLQLEEQGRHGGQAGLSGSVTNTRSGTQSESNASLL